ncbi:MAG: bacillolysin, partial [Sphingobacteriales bacterium]
MKRISILFLMTFCVLGLRATETPENFNLNKLKAKTSSQQNQEKLPFPTFLTFSENVSVNDLFTNLVELSPENGVEIIITDSESDQLGFTHYTFKQFYKGLPVEGGIYKATSEGGFLTTAGGYLYAPDLKSVSPTISENAALKKATDFIGAREYKWETPENELFIKKFENDPLATYFPKGELVVYPKTTDEGISYHLTMKFDIYAEAPLSRYFVFVDVNTGEVVNHIARIHETNANGTGTTLYNGVQNFSTDNTGSTYRLRQATPMAAGVTRKIETYDMNKGTNYNSAVDFTDGDNNFTDNTNQDRAGWSAHWAAEMTYDYVYQMFGKNSYDGNGATIKQYVHYDNNYNNAFWDGSKMTYGDGDGNTFDPLVGLDVVGHEITHAITERSSNLRYQNESGALNESFSDIFGTAVEFFAEGNGDWFIGEDFDANGGNGFRNMMNPNEDGDPDTYQGSNWKSTSVFPNLADDYGGVHSNSGVQNFWFYILTVGKSGTNDNGDAYSVSGIGIEKAAQVAFRNVQTKLSENSTYDDARAGAIASAIELYGSGSAEEIAVTNAWYAVGVGAKHPGGGGGTPTCNVPSSLSASTVSTSGATLTWAAAANATSYAVRYRVSGSSTWTNTTATGTSKAVSGLTDNTTYEFQVQSDCGGGNTSAYSSSTSFTTQTSGGGGNPVTYCASQGNSTSDEWINKVVIGSINNTSGNNSGYNDYTSMTAVMDIGGTYNFTLTPGFTSGGLFGASSYPEYWRIWIDYNKDGDFTDAGEMVFDAGGTSTAAVSGSFTIPTNVSAVTTRMRVQMKYNAAPTSCEAFGYGEVEDYTVEIKATGPVVCNAPSGLSSSNVSQTSASVSWNAATSANSYVLRYRAQGGSYTTVNVGGTSQSLSGLSATTTYEYSVKSDCGNANESGFSSTAAFTTSAPVVCNAPGGLNATSVTYNSATLNWSAAASASSYNVRYRVSGGLWANASASATSLSVSGLSATSSYEFQVQSDCGSGNTSAFSASATF